MSELDAAVELLDRALAYTRVALAGVPGTPLQRRTPCLDWDLAHLLAHMEDALDAFTEAAAGHVLIDPAPPPEPALGRIGVLRDKACTLLEAWARPTPVDQVRVGDLYVAGPVLVATAALEITVHGWDVGLATGRGRPIPQGLAVALSEVADAVVRPADRPGRFAPPVPVASDAPPDRLLLGSLGRAAGRAAGSRVA